jgi:hypothetical protein
MEKAVLRPFEAASLESALNGINPKDYLGCCGHLQLPLAAC